MAMVFFVAVANLVVFQYASGVVRAALDEGVRAGSRVDAGVDRCEQAAADVMSSLLNGSLGDEIAITCTIVDDRIVALADGDLPAFAAWVPDVELDGLAATGVREVNP